MAVVQKVEEVIRHLYRRRLLSEKDDREEVIVGFTQKYAIFVHENLEANHKVGEAKFLEKAYRLYKKDIGKIVINAMRRGATMIQGLMLAGLRIQREAQLRTPVDTGALKNSAFTRRQRK